MLLYAEHCPEVNQRSGHLLPEVIVNTLVGFRSNYSFLEEDAREIIASRSSKGLNKYRVASNVFNADLDNGEAGVKEICQFFKDKKIGYSLYSSGGKGRHLCVPTNEIISENLPEYHKAIAQKLNFGLDMSIYRHGALFRLPGTIHAKTGKPKELLEVYQGEYKMRVTEAVVKPKFKIELKPLEEPEVLRWGLYDVYELMCKPPENGNRHMTIFKTVLRLREGGASYEFILELMLHLNHSWGSRGKEVGEVEKACQGAYNYVKA